MINLINFFLAISTTLIFSITPFFITEDLGLSRRILFLIENTNEGLSNIGKTLSGFLIDRFKRSRYLIAISCVFSLLARLFLSFGGCFSLLLSKSLDRSSNGIFAVVRDTVIGLKSSNNNSGKNYGTMMVYKTLGCLIGSFMAAYLVESGLSFRLIIFISSAPICASLFFLFFTSESIVTRESASRFNFKRFFTDLMSLSPVYYYVLVLVFMFMMARISDGMIAIRLKDMGLPKWVYISTIGIFNTTSMMCIFFIKDFADRINKFKILFLPIISLLAFHVLMSQTHQIFGLLGVALWGVQRGSSQMLFSCIIADTLPSNIKGTGIGLYYFVSYLGALLFPLMVGSSVNTSSTMAFSMASYIMIFILIVHSTFYIGYKKIS